MPYLSRLILNPRSNQAQSELRNPYEMHRTLSHAFADTAAAQAEARCLFRIEPDAEGDGIAVLVQSKTVPDWDCVRSHASPAYMVSVETKELRFSFAAGQQLAFRLRANPTVAHSGQRTGIYDDAGRLKWLQRKAESSGFRAIQVLVTDEPAVRSRKRAGGPNDAVFSAARFEGLLRIIEPGKLQVAIENGIGAGKGFGFGLLSLSRP